MWLFVVAAGSGYLARCLQSASGAKKQRLIEVIDKQDENHASRSPPQEADNNYPVSKEAMQFKERFDRLAEQHQAVLDKKDGQDGGWSLTGSDSSCFPMLSYQKGYCDAQPASSRRFKAKKWSAWPKHVKGSQLGRKRSPRAGSPSNSSTCEQKGADNDVPQVLDAESEDSTAAGLSFGGQQPRQYPGIGFCEDVSRHRKIQGGTDSPEGGLLGISSLSPSKQLHAVEKGLSVSTWSRRHRIRSSTSSTPGTPGDICGPALPPVEVFLRKRKAYDTSPTKPRSHSEILRKELVFFALGLRAGVFVMLCYMTKMASRKQTAERRTDTIDSTPEGGSIDCGAGSAQAGEVDDDNESVTSVVTVEHEKPDQMAVLEAELEAELEIMEFNLQAKDLPGVKPRSDSPKSPISFDKEERNAKENWAVSPRELDRKLRIVLEERQARRIEQLETELEEKEKQLSVKEEEVRSWKLRVDRLKAIYLASAEDAGLGGPVATCDGPALERPGIRKRWFTNVRESTSVHASLPLLPSSIEEIDDNSCSGTESPKHVVFDPLDESEDHNDDASRTVRDFFRNMEELSSVSSPDSKPSTSSSMVRVLPAQRTLEAPIHRDDGYEKATTEVRETKEVYVNPSTGRRTSSLRHKSEVLHTVHSNCRIEEASSRFRDGERRHSTGSTAATRSHSQRQRRRWFS